MRLALIKEYGWEAVYGRETVTVHTDGSRSTSYSEGMTARDFSVAQAMAAAEASQREQKANNTGNPTPNRSGKTVQRKTY